MIKDEKYRGKREIGGCSNFRTFVLYRKKKKITMVEKRYNMENEKMIPFLLLSAIDFINFLSKKRRKKESK